MRRSFRQGPAGFTVVELLVAMALTIFIMGLFTGLLMQATQSVELMRGISAVDQSVRTASTILRRDLQDVYLQLGDPTLGQTPADVFKNGNVDTIPVGGYFMIEENFPAIRQGVDAWGQPVEVDCNDVLAFTAHRDTGRNGADIYYARVPKGSVLDKHTGIGVEYDLQGVENSLISANFAEIIFFLRPDGKQYTLDEVRGHALLATDTPTVTTVSTYTLHRRQLAILAKSALSANDPRTKVLVAGNNANIPCVDYYLNYDVAAKPAGAGVAVNFLTLEDMDLRHNRFGINHQQLNPYPFAWSNGADSSAVTFKFFDPQVGNPQWMGRPTSLETNAPATILGGANIFTELAAAFSSNNVDALVAQSNAVLSSTANFAILNNIWDANSPPLTYRRGEDVLLRNVISFDVKVYDDDPRDEPDATIKAATKSSPAINVNRTILAADDDQRAPEFVDVGYQGMLANIDTKYADLAPADSADPWAYNYRPGAPPVYPNQPFGFPERWRYQGRVNPHNAANYQPVRTYDTWSLDYNRVPADPMDPNYRPIPYAKPLKAIQIKLRVLEPRSKIVREATIVHRFSST